MINKVILVGRITRDPELRKAGNNDVVNFTLALDRNYTGSNGERETDFINCVVFNKQAENLSKYIKKGSLLGVEGSIRTRNYEYEGQKRTATEIFCNNVSFLDSRSSRDNTSSNERSYNEDPFSGMNMNSNENDDDLPF